MTALLLAALFTSTSDVRSVAAAGATLWAATGGGVEKYDLASGARVRLYTTEDGLASNSVLSVRADGSARTAGAECTLKADRYSCTPAGALPAPVPAVAPLFHGARETGRVRAGGKLVVATAGAGIWSNDQALTPGRQLCGNHVEALAEFQGKVWVGSFDGGLCVYADGAFRTVATPFRMVNDLRPTPQGLYVAAAEGLFFTADGARFRQDQRVRERGVNRLAATSRWLFATTPFALYAVRLDGRDVVRRFRRPAGSTALQAVAVSGADVWLASEDVGVIRMRGEKFEAFDRASGLPSSWTVDVAPAPGGGVWAATLRNGSVRLDRDGRAVELGRDAKAWGLRLYPDGGQVLFGTQQGVEGWYRPVPDPHVHAFLRTQDGLWVGTEGGLLLTN